MTRQQQAHFMRQPYARSRAVARAQEYNQNKIAAMVIYVLASAIIVLLMAYWPAVAGSIDKFERRTDASDIRIHRANKDDQLTSARFDDRWNAFTTTI